MTFIPHVIDGQESESASGARFAPVDPWTREPYAEVALGGAEALLADLGTPFGGVGDSGIGREGGTFSREFFTEPKAVVMEV